MRIETTRLEIATEEGVSIADLTGEVNAFTSGEPTMMRW
jgi:Trp operon repressor